MLNDHGRGDLGATLYALSGLDRNRLNRTRTVINMSLGFVPVRATDANATWKTVCENLGLVECGSPDAVFALVDLYPTLDPDQRRQLEDVLDGLTLRLYIADLLASGVVIVAAAGNESDAGNILAPQLPASFEDSFDAVLAVAGSTYKRERAFYANRGTLAAPGGGDNTPGCEAEPPCDPGTTTPCWCSPDHWLIGVGTQRNAGAGPPVTWRYSAWVGTSFAAPLVSGLAAAAFLAAGDASDLAEQMRQPQACSVAADPDPPDSNLGRGIASFCP